MCPQSTGKIFCGQLLCKIRAFFEQKYIKFGNFVNYSGKNRVIFGHFVNFSYIQGGPKKLDHFCELITLRQLVIERHIICQNFANFV